jgi:hypothetical protein
VSAVADIIPRLYGHHAIPPRRIRRRVAIVAVQKTQVLQEGCVTYLGAIGNLEANARVLVSSFWWLCLECPTSSAEIL